MILPRETLARLGIGLAIALAVNWLLRQAGLLGFVYNDVEGLNVLIQLTGDIYAVLLAFAIFVIWGQFTDVENCVIREANSLGDILRFNNYLNPGASGDVRRAMAAYTHQVLNYEWPLLGDGQADPRAEQLFVRFVNAIVELAPQNESEQALRTRLLDMAQKASEYRDERVARSLIRMPPTLAGLVRTIAFMILLLVFIYPFHRWFTGMACFSLVAVALFLADFVMMDTDNPLKGVWNVSPAPFSDLRL